MSTKAFANENVMEDYMSALLVEESATEKLQRQSVEQLLKTAPAPRTEPFYGDVERKVATEVITTQVIEPKVESKLTPAKKPAKVIKPVVPTSAFQVLIFEVAGMTLAVPLMELGGIHKIEGVSPLFGKPKWFGGVMILRDEKYNVVDTIDWIMPEKSAEKVAESKKYQYLIVLGESHWGLSCESLVNNETLLPEDVKWRNVEGSRPWLSGMVKKKMCALVNVKQLINMLDQGLSSND